MLLRVVNLEHHVCIKSSFFSYLASEESIYEFFRIVNFHSDFNFSIVNIQGTVFNIFV